MKKKEKKEIIQMFLYLMNAEYHSYREVLITSLIISHLSSSIILFNII